MAMKSVQDWKSPEPIELLLPLTAPCVWACGAADGVAPWLPPPQARIGGDPARYGSYELRSSGADRRSSCLM